MNLKIKIKFNCVYNTLVKITIFIWGLPLDSIVHIYQNVITLVLLIKHLKWLLISIWHQITNIYRKKLIFSLTLEKKLYVYTTNACLYYEPIYPNKWYNSNRKRGARWPIVCTTRSRGLECDVRSKQNRVPSTCVLMLWFWVLLPWSGLVPLVE